MKRTLISILASLAALLVLFSCDPTKNNPEVQDTLTVNPTSLEFEAEDASTKLVYVTTEKDWTATPSANWIRMEKTSGTGKGTLAVTVDANTGEDRSGSITVKGSKTETIAVSQSDPPRPINCSSIPSPTVTATGLVTSRASRTNWTTWTAWA